MDNLKKTLKVIVNVLTYILIGIVTIYLIFAIYNRFINKDGRIFAGNYYMFQIATGSMEPNLSIGDYIIVKKTEDYKVGDIVTYIEDGCYITHRINEINGYEIITKGDANNLPDSPINKEAIVGKLLFREMILTFLSRYKVIVIAILIALIILENVFSKEEKNKKKKILKFD